MNSALLISIPALTGRAYCFAKKTHDRELGIGDRVRSGMLLNAFEIKLYAG